jgi:hypothetical protein
MEIYKFLGDLLSERINISPPAARGLLRLSIKDEFGPFKPIEQLDYEDLLSVILNSLPIRLKKLEVKSIEKLISFLAEELTKNQSLITMSSV